MDNQHSGAARLSARMRGEVQGVGFRYWTLRRAQALGLVGEVRNQPDGSVTVLAEGPRPALDGLLEWLQGPETPGVVQSVDYGFGAADGSFGEFRTG